MSEIHKGDGTMRAKYKMGDGVIYNRGTSAEKVRLSRTVEVTIQKVTLDYNGILFSQPIYTVSWPPRGNATMGESSLTAPSDTDATEEGG